MKHIFTVLVSIFLMCANAYAAKTVFIVDDSGSLRQMAGIALRGAGYSVEEGVDGSDGFQRISRKAPPYDLLIIDSDMPGMDGYQLTQKVRSMPQYARTPIFIMLIDLSPQSQSRARSAGANGFIPKPFEPQRLVETVKKTIN